MTIPNTTYRVLVEKLGAQDALNFIGNEGEVFYDPNNPGLKLSNGTTPGGIFIGGSFDTVEYASTVNLDMSLLDGSYNTINLTGNLELTASNRAIGRTVVIRIISDGSQRTLTFPIDWKFLGTKPANIAASKTGVLSITFFGSADSDCVTVWGVQS